MNMFVLILYWWFWYDVNFNTSNILHKTTRIFGNPNQINKIRLKGEKYFNSKIKTRPPTIKIYNKYIEQLNWMAISAVQNFQELLNYWIIIFWLLNFIPNGDIKTSCRFPIRHLNLILVTLFLSLDFLMKSELRSLRTKKHKKELDFVIFTEYIF